MKQKHITLFVLLFCLSGCELVVDVNVPIPAPVLVVNTLFENNKPWRTSVSLSRGPLDENPFPRPADATVTIEDIEANTTETLNNDYNGNFSGTTSPQPGRQYRIRATAPGRTAVEAMGSVPDVVPLTTFEIGSSIDSEVPVTLAFTDPAQTKNYYKLEITVEYYYDIVPPSDTLWAIQNVYFEALNPAYQSIIDTYGEFIFSDELFNGKSFTLACSMQEYYQRTGNGTKIYATLYNLSKEYYNYSVTVSQQSISEDDPFAQPAQVYTNIKNGLGIFAGYSISKVKR